MAWRNHSSRHQDDLTLGESERLRASIGVIGDQATAGTASPEELFEHPTFPPGDRRLEPERGRRTLVGTVAAGLLMLGGVGAWSLGRAGSGRVEVQDDGGGQLPSPVDRATTPATSDPTTIPPTSVDEASPAVTEGVNTAEPASTGSESAWYELDLEGVQFGELVTLDASSIPGHVARVWASDDGSFREVLTLNRFTSDPGVTTLAGEEGTPGTPLFPGRLHYYVTSDDVPDAENPGTHGDEMRMETPDGEVWEFSSFGMDPFLLQKYVLIAWEQSRDCSPCDLPSFDEIASSTTGGGNEQAWTLDGATMTLRRSSTPSVLDIDGWTSTAPTDIVGSPGFVVDGDTAIWSAEGHWFSLDEIPPDRLDEVLGALRRVPTWEAERAGTSNGAPRWFVVDLPDVEAQGLTMGSADAAGPVQFWVNAEGHFTTMLSMVRLGEGVPISLIVGTEPTRVDSLTGTLTLYADAADPPDPARPEWRGNEARWEREDGVRWEFASYGISPSELVQAIKTIDGWPAEPCACMLDGLRRVPKSPTSAYLFRRQEIRLGDATMSLWQAAVPNVDLRRATTIEALEIGDLPAALVDGTRIIWEAGDLWYELSDVPPERAREVAAAIRGADALPSQA